MRQSVGQTACRRSASFPQNVQPSAAGTHLAIKNVKGGCRDVISHVLLLLSGVSRSKHELRGEQGV